MTHTIRIFPDPGLRAVCQPVQSYGAELNRVIHALRQTLKHQTMGIGIAAPQIGIPLRVAIVNVGARVPGAAEILLINPQILKIEGEKLSHEGCMSLPEYTGYVRRAETVHYYTHDINGQRLFRQSSGLEAVCVQHEMDHLDGKLFFDRVETLKTDMHPRHWKKRNTRPRR